MEGENCPLESLEHPVGRQTSSDVRGIPLAKQRRPGLHEPPSRPDEARQAQHEEDKQQQASPRKSGHGNRLARTGGATAISVDVVAVVTIFAQTRLRDSITAELCHTEG